MGIVTATDNGVQVAHLVREVLQRTGWAVKTSSSTPAFQDASWKQGGSDEIEKLLKTGSGHRKKDGRRNVTSSPPAMLICGLNVRMMVDFRPATVGSYVKEVSTGQNEPTNGTLCTRTGSLENP